MKYDPSKHHRRSIRLKGYDYHNTGAYFVTICTKNRVCVLDDPIVQAIIYDVWLALPMWFPTIELDEFVIMPNHVHFVIWLGVHDVGMPFAGVQDVGTPLAGVLGANEKDGNVGTPLASVQDANEKDGNVGTPLASVQDANEKDGNVGTPLAGVQNTNEKDGGKPRPYIIPSPEKSNPNPALGDVVGAFKSLVFKVYLNWIKANDPSRRAKFWQDNYYEHIVRNDKELNVIRQYIIDNPANWSVDRDNPDNEKKLPPPSSVDDYLADLKELKGWQSE